MNGDEDFLKRWSRRKRAARQGQEEEVIPAGDKGTGGQVATGIQGPEPSVPKEAAPPLPPIESLTIDSDFSAFMQPGVDPALKRGALNVLLRDPRFNVMDGLDVYIDDYSKPDPLPEGWLEQMNQMKHLGHYLEVPEAAEKGAEEAPAALQNSMPEQPFELDTEKQSDANVDVTDAGTAGDTLPRNEA